MSTVYSRYLWLILLCLLPFVYNPALSEPYELPKAFVLAFLALATIGLNYRTTIGHLLLHVKGSITYRLLTLYLICQSISWLLNGYSNEGFWGDFYRYQGLFTFGVLTLLTITTKLTDKDAATINRTLGWSGILVGILATLIPSSTFGNPNFAAFYLAMTAPFAPIWAAAVFFVGIYSLKSRAALIALSATTLLRLYRPPFRFVNIALLAIALVGVFIFFPHKPTSSFDNRPLIWTKSLQAIAHKPLFGWGVENFDTAFQSSLSKNGIDIDLAHIRIDRAHNIFLDIAVSNGIIGLTVFLALIITALINSSGAPRLALITFLIASQFNVISLTNWVLFFYLIKLSTFHGQK